MILWYDILSNLYTIISYNSFLNRSFNLLPKKIFYISVDTSTSVDTLGLFPFFLCVEEEHWIDLQGLVQRLRVVGSPTGR